MTLTRNTASYLNQYRIRVNQINPGWTLTPNEQLVKLAEGKGEGWVEEAVTLNNFCGSCAKSKGIHSSAA